jgi:hypothetical protein
MQDHEPLNLDAQCIDLPTDNRAGIPHE